jgi:hypothetical protein
MRNLMWNSFPHQGSHILLLPFKCSDAQFLSWISNGPTIKLLDLGDECEVLWSTQQ